MDYVSLVFTRRDMTWYNRTYS